jgi:hypothetical protein
MVAIGSFDSCQKLTNWKTPSSRNHLNIIILVFICSDLVYIT